MNVSIVTPVHNEQGNISKLLDDLIKLKRRLKNFEIIVVDDNSSDKTGLIAHYYSKKYKNIKVLHRSKDVNGMGAALKDGTKAAYPIDPSNLMIVELVEDKKRIKWVIWKE